MEKVIIASLNPSLNNADISFLKTWYVYRNPNFKKTPLSSQYRRLHVYVITGKLKGLYQLKRIKRKRNDIAPRKKIIVLKKEGENNKIK